MKRPYRNATDMPDQLENDFIRVARKRDGTSNSIPMSLLTAESHSLINRCERAGLLAYAYSEFARITPRGLDLLATADAIGYEPFVPPRDIEVVIGPPMEVCSDCKGEGTKQLFTSRHECDTCKGAKKVVAEIVLQDDCADITWDHEGRHMAKSFHSWQIVGRGRVSSRLPNVQSLPRNIDGVELRMSVDPLYNSPYAAVTLDEAHRQLLLGACLGLLDASPVMRTHVPDPNPPGSNSDD